MPKYVIERPLPGAGELSAEQLHDISAKSNQVIAGLGPEIRWIQSYVTTDKIYCVYVAADEDIVYEHARCGGFPAESVSLVSAMIDPATGEERFGPPRRCGSAVRRPAPSSRVGRSARRARLQGMVTRC